METNKQYKLIIDLSLLFYDHVDLIDRANKRHPRDLQQTEEIVWRPAVPLRHGILTFAIDCY